MTQVPQGQQLPCAQLRTASPAPAGSPAVLPGIPDVLQLGIPHVGHGEDEEVLVRVHTFPKLWNKPRGSSPRGTRAGQHSGLRRERLALGSLPLGRLELEASKTGAQRIGAPLGQSRGDLKVQGKLSHGLGSRGLRLTCGLFSLLCLFVVDNPDTLSYTRKAPPK